MVTNRKKKSIKTNVSISGCRGAVARKFENEIKSIRDVSRKLGKQLSNDAIERIAYLTKKVDEYRNEEWRYLFQTNVIGKKETTIY